MATVTGLTIVKKFLYRGNANEEFSNTYHFRGSPPGDDASWLVLLNDIVGAERECFPSSVTYQRAYGYDNGDPGSHHVFVHDWETAPPAPVGSFPAAGNSFAGDQAACIWWLTDKLNKRGKPIYLRKYFHAGYVSPGNADTLEASYAGALGFITDMQNGMNRHHGGLTNAANDCVAVSGGHVPWATTRTLKRRGKRPPPGN